MISFAFLDAQGLPTGGGRLPALPEGAVALADPFTLSDLPRIRFRDGGWEERPDQPAPDPEPDPAARAAWHLARARAVSIDRINAAAGRARLRFYTDIPAQDAVYLEKRAEAVAFVAAVDHGSEPATLDDYPYLAGEVGATAPTAWQLAQIWLHRNDLFRQVGAATETARRRAIVAVESAPDEAAIETAERDFNEALNGLSN